MAPGKPHAGTARRAGGVLQSQSILFDNNAVLRRLPAFSSMNMLPDLVTITSNPELEELRLDFALASSIGVEVGGEILPMPAPLPCSVHARGRWLPSE